MYKDHKLVVHLQIEIQPFVCLMECQIPQFTLCKQFF